MTNEKASIIVGNLPINGDECYSISEYQQAKAMAIKALEQQKTGHWIQDGRVDDDGNIYFYCSNCKRGDTHAKGQKVPYCWYCGARMEADNGKDGL